MDLLKQIASSPLPMYSTSPEDIDKVRVVRAAARILGGGCVGSGHPLADRRPRRLRAPARDLGRARSLMLWAEAIPTDTGEAAINTSIEWQEEGGNSLNAAQGVARKEVRMNFRFTHGSPAAADPGRDGRAKS